MPTRPKNDPTSIATDGRHVHQLSNEDAADPNFKKRISAHERTVFGANIDLLAQSDADSKIFLHAQVEAGVHVAHARSRVVAMLKDIRDDAKLGLTDNAEIQHAFGLGANLHPTSTPQVRHLATEALRAAHKHPDAAAKVGLDTHGIHLLEDLIHALDGAELAHAHAISERHSNTVHLDSLAHLVSAEAAHIRLAARRVFREDPVRLARYDRTLPRHAVEHRTTEPTPPPAT